MPRVKESGKHEAFAFRFRDGVAKFAGGIDPQLDGLVGVGKSRFRRVAVSHTAGKFRHFGNKYLIFVAPMENNLVLVHAYSFSPSSPYRRTWRTWRT